MEAYQKNKNPQDFERLKAALDSEKIKPLYEEWRKSDGIFNRIYNFAANLFFVGTAITIIYLGIGIYHDSRNLYQLMRRPELVQYEQIAKTQGYQEASRIVEKNQATYKPIIDDYLAGEQLVKRNFDSALVTTIINGVVSLGTLSWTLMAAVNSRRKRIRLEEALYEQNLSLQDLEAITKKCQRNQREK